METIYLLLRAQVAVGTLFMESPVSTCRHNALQSYLKLSLGFVFSYIFDGEEVCVVKMFTMMLPKTKKLF